VALRHLKKYPQRDDLLLIPNFQASIKLKLDLIPADALIFYRL
jgi:hypothetical protein